ncbi:hypothetical protein BCU74_03910 [Vibrio breoganii]|uniref:hypothetical protein n=1 Tax=Vibrio breoganii TaxID=553239 RepID=UPI000C81DBDB|nr:hypothetical protein [Vibrio breoganii]PMH22242.1 hypothetical protein BCU74_03910 [Vibrio breoganii]
MRKFTDEELASARYKQMKRLPAEELAEVVAGDFIAVIRMNAFSALDDDQLALMVESFNEFILPVFNERLQTKVN